MCVDRSNFSVDCFKAVPFSSWNVSRIFIVGQPIVYMGCVVFRIMCVIWHIFMSRVLLLARDGCIDCGFSCVSFV